MDELREILNKLYEHKIKPDEAQWEITKMFNRIEYSHPNIDKETIEKYQNLDVKINTD